MWKLQYIIAVLSLFLFSVNSASAATLTVYPDADVETTTVDGRVQRSGVDEIFSTIRDGAGVSSNDSVATLVLQLSTSATTDQFDVLVRGITLFDTSTIGAGSTITAAVLSLFGNASGNSNAIGSPALHIGSATPASNTALVGADYTQIGRTSFGNIAYASWNTTAYNDITLDSNGIANISKTGISKFSQQLSWDINNSFTGTWSGSTESFYRFENADVVGTDSDPKLVVTYTPKTFRSLLIVE